MKAFWLFARNENGAPALPAGHGGRHTNPLDIVRMTGGPAGGEHTHLLLGGFALADANLQDLPGAYHTHLVVNANAGYVQVTENGTYHTHDLPLDAGGNLSPDWFLLFWHGPDAGAAAIAASSDCFPIVEAAIGPEGDVGALDNTPWTAQEANTWQTRCLNLLGFALPAQVDRGKRLVRIFAGALLARPGNERALRFNQ